MVGSTAAWSAKASAPFDDSDVIGEAVECRPTFLLWRPGAQHRVMAEAVRFRVLAACSFSE
jgi:hypothetical protein